MAEKKRFYNKKYEEMKERIKNEISILDIAEEYGMKVVKKGSYYGIDGHRSVIIYPDTNSFYRWSAGAGGDVFAFMSTMEEINLSYSEAYKVLSQRLKGSEPVRSSVKKNKDLVDSKKAPKTLEEKKARSIALLNQFSHPKPNTSMRFDDNCKNIYAYLIKERKIDPDIIATMIKKGTLKQAVDDQGYKYVAFIGYDDIGLVSGIGIRSCMSKSSFKSDIVNSDYQFGWLYDNEVNPTRAYSNQEHYDPNKPLYCFESYIDMMSYMTLMKQNGKDINAAAFLSCGSATKYKTVIYTMKTYGYKNIVECFDNDDAGRLFSAKLRQEVIKKEGTNFMTILPPDEKDWNDYLKSISIPSVKKSIEQAQQAALKKTTVRDKLPKKVINR